VQQSTGRKFPLVFPWKTSLRWIGFDCGNRLCLGIAAFNPIWIGLLQPKCLRENRSSAGRFQVYWRWGKLAPFRFSTPLCTIRPYTARPSCKTLLSMKSALRTKPQHRCFTHATIQHPVLVQPVIWLYQKRFSKSGIHRGQWSLIENFRQKRIKSRF
jgi:hypothetical protein